MVGRGKARRSGRNRHTLHTRLIPSPARLQHTHTATNERRSLRLTIDFADKTFQHFQIGSSIGQQFLKTRLLAVLVGRTGAWGSGA